MADTLSKEERSERMSRIRGKDTKPELALRSAMHSLGFRFRLHGSKLPGRPDLVFPKYRAVVFMHGCFWHRHQACKIASTPKSNTSFWQAKFARNVERDARSVEALEALGWRVFTVWECQITEDKIQRTAAALADMLREARLVEDDPLAHALS